MPTKMIDGYTAHLRSETRSSRTIGDRRRVLLILDQDLPHGLERACADEIVEWLWRDGLKVSSRETYYGAIAGFYAWAYRAEILDYNPMDHVTRPRVPNRMPRPCTDDELRRILATAAEPYNTWALIAAYAGARCLEISRLQRDQITQQSMMLLGKGTKLRPVPTHPAIWDRVRDLPPGRITEYDERYISIRTAVYLRRSLKMPGMSLHRLRHWFGTNVQRLHKDLRVTQQLMGHADPRTTAGYALVADEDARVAVNLLPTLGD